MDQSTEPIITELAQIPVWLSENQQPQASSKKGTPSPSRCKC